MLNVINVINVKCYKDIKVISVLAIFVTLCQLWKWFCMLRKLWKPPSRKGKEKKISVAEFRHSQTIFLSFTVTLFHSNLDEKITSNEQKLTSNEQRAKRSALFIPNSIFSTTYIKDIKSLAIKHVIPFLYTFF